MGFCDLCKAHAALSKQLKMRSGQPLSTPKPERNRSMSGDGEKAGNGEWCCVKHLAKEACSFLPVNNEAGGEGRVGVDLNEPPQNENCKSSYCSSDVGCTELPYPQAGLSGGLQEPRD